MKKVLQCCLSALTVSTLSAAPTLDLGRAAGGKVTGENDKRAVFLSAEATPQDSVVIPLSEALTPGIWLGDFELFGPSPRFSPNTEFIFDTASPLKMNGYFMSLKNGFFKQKAGFIIESQATKLTLKMTWSRKLDCLGIAAATFAPAKIADFANLPIFLELKVEKGEIKLPAGLPYGIYQFSFPKPLAVRWSDAAGQSVDTPALKAVTISIRNLSGGKVLNGDFSGMISAARYLERGSLAPYTGKALPITKDAAKLESNTLVIKCSALNAAPGFTTYPGGKPLALVTSWDDGRNQDFKLTEILTRYGVRGTLVMNRNSEVLPRLKELEARGFEIGSHSVTHPFMYLSSPERCLAEGQVMRADLEERLGHPVISFVYPFGYQASYDLKGDYVTNSLAEAGYWASRTTTSGTTHLDAIPNLLALPNDFHFNTPPDRIRQRLEAARKEKPGAMIYLWGHSYELDNGGDKKLEAALGVLAKQPDVWYATQGEFSVWQFLRANSKINPGAKPGEWIVKIPWIHSFLRTVPLTVELPPGTTEAIWNGKALPIIDNRIVCPY